MRSSEIALLDTFKMPVANSPHVANGDKVEKKFPVIYGGHVNARKRGVISFSHLNI